MEDFIKKGDFVDFYFTGIPCEMDVEVLYIPSEPNDYWITKRKDGTMVNIFTFSKVVKEKK